MRDAIQQYCAKIGKNPLLVQGAGGNVSWKEGGTLWIKASGTRLSDALMRDIFVPVDLHALRDAIMAGHFDVIPRVSQTSSLRPSIETHFHALMPHRIIVHLHAIDILSYLVRANVETSLHQLIPSSVSWLMVDYYKPGSELARVMSQALHQKPGVNVVFLKNHGVVVGGADIQEVDQVLNLVLENMPTRYVSPSVVPPEFSLTINESITYIPIQDPAIHQLVHGAEWMNHLEKNWALYPDHVVFLGDRPATYDSIALFIQNVSSNKVVPELIFIENVGVFSLPSFSPAKQEQLRCYYDVLSRQTSSDVLNALNINQINELVNWDAERYRINLHAADSRILPLSFR